MRLRLLVAMVIAATYCHAQISLSGHLSPAMRGKTISVNVPFDCWVYRANNQKVTPDNRGDFLIKLPLNQAQIIFLTCADQQLHLYAEPGKTLAVWLDTDTLRFGGSLGQQNQLRHQLGLTAGTLGPSTWNDSLSTPRQILNHLREQQQQADNLLKASYFRPSASFWQMTQADIRYFAVSKLWDLIWRNGVWTGRNHSRYGQNDWRAVLTEAYEAISLSDSTALTSYHYQTAVTYYPRYLQHKAVDKAAFVAIAEAVFNQPFAFISQDIRQRGERYWEYSALNYGLKGVSLQRALVSLLTQGIYQGDLQYQQEAYADFMQRFPDSPYRRHLQTVMQPYLASLAKDSLADIHIVTESPQLLRLDSLLARHRGRVVYLDLWGSWCGPCREEFAFNQALKERFRGKSVDFVYVAVEHHPNPEKIWRQTIAFYKLTGEHILAGKALTDDLRSRYAQLQFPSYIVVDKTGKIVTLYGKRPSEQEALYAQIEELL